MSVIDQIKSQSDIISYIQQDGVELKKESGSRWGGICPFHDEKTGSFKVDEEKQKWHCFGACNEHGDIIDYVQKRSNCEKAEAIHLLASHYGIAEQAQRSVPNLVTTPGRARKIVQDYAHSQIKNTSKQKKWLNERDVDNDDIDRWGIGIATGTMVNDLKDKISIECMTDIGLVKKKGERYYDFIKEGMIMIPVRNAKDQISHWMLRDIENKNNYQMYAKHRNGGIIFNMGDLNNDSCYIVEGFFEVNQLTKQGAPASAMMGKWNNKQIAYLRSRNEDNEYFEELSQRKSYYIWMDRDGNNAGQEASIAIASQIYHFFEIFIVRSPEVGQDPDDYLRAGGMILPEMVKRFESPEYRVKKTFSGYVIKDTDKDGIDSPRMISNFIIDIKYHFLQAADERIRMITVTNKGKGSPQLFMTGEDMSSRQRFQTFLNRKTRASVLKGDVPDFEELMEYIKETDVSKTIDFSQYYGNIKDDTWLWDNGAIVNGEVSFADKDGISWIGENGADGVRTTIGTDKEGPHHSRQIIPKEWMSFDDIISGMHKSYPRAVSKALLGFAVANFCRQEIIGYYNSFMHLLHFGRTGSGKTKGCELVQSLLGGTAIPTDTCRSTSKAFLRHIAKYRNQPIQLSEYDVRFLEDLKAIFDQTLYSKARATSGNETIDPEVNASVIFTSETTPSGESLLNRCIIINFNEFNYSKAASNDYNEFWAKMVMEKGGFGFLVELTKTDIKSRIMAKIKELKDAMVKKDWEWAEDRMLTTYSIIYGSFMAMYEDPILHPTMKKYYGDIPPSKLMRDIETQVQHAMKLVKGQNLLQGFFSLFNTLYVSEMLEHFVELVPDEDSPVGVRFMMNDVFNQIIAYDNRTKRVMQNVQKTDIEYQIRETFGVTAKSAHMEGLGNRSSYTLPLDQLDKMYGITFRRIKYSDDDGYKQDETFDPDLFTEEAAE